MWSDEVGPNGGYLAFAHRALPFGALRAVWVYTAISQGVCAILRRLLAVPQLAYADDFLRVGPKWWAAAQEDAFRRIHAALGIPLKHGKDDVAHVIKALGHRIGATPKWAGLCLTEKRRESLLEKLKKALAHGFKDKGDTGPAERLPELTGHVNFGMQAVA